MVAKFALLLFPLLMAFAASSDLLTMRISNRVVLLLVAMFCAVAIGAEMPIEEFGLHVACATIVLMAAFAFFALGSSAGLTKHWMQIDCQTRRSTTVTESGSSRPPKAGCGTTA